MICEVLGVRQSAKKKPVEENRLLFKYPLVSEKAFFYFGGAEFQPVILSRKTKKMSALKKIKNVIQLENH